jgi:hypothetical protein
MLHHQVRRADPQAPARTDQQTRPVFVDRSGRRRRLITMVGAAFGVLLLLGLIGLGVSLMGGDGAQPPGWPGADGVAGPKPSVAATSVQPSTAVTTRTGLPSATPSMTPKKTTTTPPGQVNTHRPTTRPTNTRKP